MTHSSTLVEEVSQHLEALSDVTAYRLCKARADFHTMPYVQLESLLAQMEAASESLRQLHSFTEGVMGALEFAGAVD